MIDAQSTAPPAATQDSPMLLPKCECEHLAHFDRDARTSSMNPGHSYGRRFAPGDMREVRTEFGAFQVCKECSDVCLGSGLVVEPTRFLRVVSPAPGRKFICRHCKSVLQHGDPPAAYGLCDDCHDELAERRRAIAKYKADALACQHLSFFVLEYDSHPDRFGPAELLEVASKIGCAWDAENRAILGGRDDSLWGMRTEASPRT